MTLPELDQKIRNTEYALEQMRQRRSVRLLRMRMMNLMSLWTRDKQHYETQLHEAYTAWRDAYRRYKMEDEA